MTCLLAHAVRALNYSRRLGRGRLVPRARAISQSRISAPCGCCGRAKCDKCARETKGRLKRSESARRDECGKGSGALTNRDRALATVKVAARPTDQTHPRPGERLMAQLPGDSDSVGLWPVLSDTGSVAHKPYTRLHLQASSKPRCGAWRRCRRRLHRWR